MSHWAPARERLTGEGDAIDGLGGSSPLDLAAVLLASLRLARRPGRVEFEVRRLEDTPREFAVAVLVIVEGKIHAYLPMAPMPCDIQQRNFFSSAVEAVAGWQSVLLEAAASGLPLAHSRRWRADMADRDPIVLARMRELRPELEVCLAGLDATIAHHEVLRERWELQSLRVCLERLLQSLAKTERNLDKLQRRSAP